MLEADGVGGEPWRAPAALALLVPTTSCQIWVGEGRCLRQHLLPRHCKHCSPSCPFCQVLGPALVIPPLLTSTSCVTLALPLPIDKAPDLLDTCSGTTATTATRAAPTTSNTAKSSSSTVLLLLVQLAEQTRRATPSGFRASHCVVQEAGHFVVNALPYYPASPSSTFPTVSPWDYGKTCLVFPHR